MPHMATPVFRRELGRKLRTFSRQIHTRSPDGPVRVVVTGIGVVSPFGVGKKLLWDNVIGCKSAIRRLTDPVFDGSSCKVAAVVRYGTGPGEFDDTIYVTKADKMDMSKSSILAIAGAHEALSDAEWHPSTQEQQEYTGVTFGIGLADTNSCYTNYKAMVERGPRRISPHFYPKYLLNMGAGLVSIRHQLKGPINTITLACASGAAAIGDAFRFIRNGDARVMVTGGYEHTSDPFIHFTFDRTRALSSKFNDTPATSCRPFHPDRDGFVMGEGAGVLVLEDLDHALTRNAHIYAEILGYGLAGDAYHVTAPTRDGNGAFRAMNAALRDSRLDKHHVTHINAHATGTPIGDAAEAAAMMKLFDGDTSRVRVTSIKASVGHCQGAAGAIESVTTILACQQGILPPTLNLDKRDPEFDLNFVANEPQQWRVGSGDQRRIALTNSFGFGGVNSSLCFAEWRG